MSAKRYLFLAMSAFSQSKFDEAAILFAQANKEPDLDDCLVELMDGNPLAANASDDEIDDIELAISSIKEPIGGRITDMLAASMEASVSATNLEDDLPLDLLQEELAELPLDSEGFPIVPEHFSESSDFDEEIDWDQVEVIKA